MISETEPLNASLGVVALCLNEERDLPGFLEHLLPWVHEIILIDDGSTDRSRQIAENAGPKVKFIENKRSEQQGFAGQRNLGIQHSSADWIINMDIDERITPALRDEILKKIQKTPNNAFRYRRLNFFLGRPMRAGGWDSWNYPQLARSGKHSYAGAIHEQCIVDGAPDSVGQLDSPMWHLNDENYLERMRKSFQYSEIEARKLLDQGRRISALKLFLATLKEFLKKYLIKQGFLDGTPGLIAAIHSADAVFRAHALAWDAQNAMPRTKLEANSREVQAMRADSR